MHCGKCQNWCCGFKVVKPDGYDKLIRMFLTEIRQLVRDKENLRVTAGFRMKQLACIFFHVNPCDPKLPMPTTKLHRKVQIDITLLGNGDVKLRNLVPLGEVWVEILLAIKLGRHRDLVVEGESRLYSMRNLTSGIFILKMLKLKVPHWLWIPTTTIWHDSNTNLSHTLLIFTLSFLKLLWP